MKRLMMIPIVGVSLLNVACMKFEYAPNHVYNTGGQITETNDKNEKVVTVFDYRNWGIGAGADGTYGSSDDDIYSYLKTTLDQNDYVVSLQRFTALGDDKKLFSASDKTQTLIETVQVGAVERVIFYDGSPTTGNASFVDRYRGRKKIPFRNYQDDVLSFSPKNKFAAQFSTPDSFGQSIDYPPSAYYGPQAPPTSFLNVNSFQYGSLSYMEKRATVDGFLVVTFHSSGKDYKWFSTDDAVTRYHKVVVTASSDVTYVFESSGPDGIWFTVDDVYSYILYREYDGENRVKVEKKIMALGDDGVVNTSDDLFEYVSEWQYVTNESTKTISMRTRSVGPYSNTPVAESELTHVSGQLMITDDNNIALFRSYPIFQYQYRLGISATSIVIDVSSASFQGDEARGEITETLLTKSCDFIDSQSFETCLSTMELKRLLGDDSAVKTVTKYEKLGTGTYKIERPNSVTAEIEFPKLILVNKSASAP